MIGTKKKAPKVSPNSTGHPIRLVLPYPPSMNTYWRRVGARTVLSKKGREYKALVGRMLDLEHIEPLPGPLSLTILAFPPDERIRDMDNIQKALMDSLKGWAYQDDSQVDCLGVERHQTTPGGAVLIDLKPVPTWEQLPLTEAMALAGLQMGPASLAWRPQALT